jgi:tripartite-type tricarboxylate transporter receptor subunit TctC
MNHRATPSRRKLMSLALMMGVAAFASKPAAAQSPADFYKGKTIHILVGHPPGGSYDFYARLAADMVKAHIPTVDAVVVENKPGGGGLVATASLYGNVPKDGTYLAVLPETVGHTQVMEPAIAKWKMENFNMIGSFAPVNSAFMLRKNSPVATAEEMKTKQIVVGCTGKAAQSYQYPAMLKALAGFKFKMVCGYGGAGDYTLALSRGEIDMVSSAWNSWRVTSMQEINSGELIPVIQAGLKRVKELATVPLMQELVADAESKQAIEFASAAAPIGRALFAPPGLPKDRVDYLRKVFDEMTADPKMIENADRRGLLLEPTPGLEIQGYVKGIVTTPADIVKKAAAAYEG